MSAPSLQPLLELREVSKRFSQPLDLAGKIARVFGVDTEPQVVHAVDGVSLSIAPGEVVGLVGNRGAENRRWRAWPSACIL